MNIKTEAVAFVIRLLANETSLIRKPNDFETLLNDLFGIESYDRRMARAVVADAERAVEATKKARVNRKFKKITKDF